MKIETYVEWLMPGAFFPEESNRKVNTRDLAKIEVPKDAYAFTFYDVKTVKAVDEEGKEHEIKTTENKSPRHIVGEVYTHEQIMAMGDKFRILASNISQYETKSGVKTHLGNWQPLLEDDVVHSKEELKFGEAIFYKS